VPTVPSAILAGVACVRVGDVVAAAAASCAAGGRAVGKGRRNVSKARRASRPVRGFQHLRRVCGLRGRSPSCCYHDDNPGTTGKYGGGQCIKRHCPVWIDIEGAR